MIVPVRKAEPFVLTAKDMEALVATMAPRIRLGFLAAVELAQAQATLDELAELVVTGQIQQAIDAAARAGAVAVADISNAALAASGQAIAKAMTEHFGVMITYDQTNIRAVAAMQNNRLRLVRNFTEEQRFATRDALLDGIRRGLNPVEQARNFRASIGLTQRQQQAVVNYRRLLREGSSQSLTRQLRDRRFDSTVRRSIAGDITLSESQIDRMVGRYRDRSVKYRSEVIARTEALRSVHEGTEEAFAQAMDDGLIDRDSAVRTWITARDERVREPAHTLLNGIQAEVGEDFISGEGNALRFPGDPNAPASETIQCRCVLTTRVDQVAV